MTDNFNPLNGDVSSKPYDGIEAKSYGALSDGHLSLCGEKASNDTADSAYQEIGRSLVGTIYKPIGGQTVNDRTLRKEELQDQFRTIDNLAFANVVVLDRGKGGISFRHCLDEVSPDEVAHAAAKFCAYHARAAKPLGSARRCGRSVTMPSSIRINGSANTVTPTFVIASFACR